MREGRSELIAGVVTLVLLVALIALIALKFRRDQYDGEIRVPDDDKLPAWCRIKERDPSPWQCKLTSTGVVCWCLGSVAEYRRGGW